MSRRDDDVLVDELRRLVSWPTQNVAATLPVLRRLAQADDPSTAANERAVSGGVLRVVLAAIDALDGPVDVVLSNGRAVTVEAASARRAYASLFWLGAAQPRPSHEHRRRQAIAHLGLDMTVTHWRRDGPERGLLQVLAHRLLDAPAPADRYVHDAFDLTYAFDEQGRLFEHNVHARLRALTEQRPRSELVLVTDCYPGHSFRLEQLVGSSVVGDRAAAEGLPLRVQATGPALRPGDVLNVAARFSVRSGSVINRVAWVVGVAEVATIRLQFDAARVPRSVWRFSDAESPEEGMVTAAQEAPVQTLAGGCFQVFEKPSRDRWFGLVWSWTR